MPENQNCSRTYATFVITGKDLDTRIISSSLNIQPSHSFMSGDKRGNSGVWRHGHWELTSQDNVNSTDLGYHIQWLLDQLEPVRSQIKEILQKHELASSIYCFWESKTGHGGPIFPVDLMRRLAEMNLELQLDLYFNL